MQLNTEIEIEAAAERVWQVLVDFPRYPEWNPFISRIEGQLKATERLEVSLGSSGGRQWTLRPKLLVVEPFRELRWRGQLFFKGLFEGEHFFLLSPAGAERTRFVHGENFNGFLVQYMTRLLTDTARGFVGMNQALKRRVEGTP